MALNFVSIDFETAAPKWDTVCSVALCRVRDGCIVDMYDSLVDPECAFGPIQMRIHGITPTMVAGAPTFAEISDQVLTFIGDDVLISHNIPFDANVLQRVLVKYNRPVPQIRTFCTYACSCMYMPQLPSHRLPAICEALGVDLVHHHDAAADALACAESMITMARRMEADSLDDVLTSLRVQYGRISQAEVIPPRMANGKPIYTGKNARPASNPFAVLDALRSRCPDFSNEITLDQLSDGKSVVFKSSGSVVMYLTTGMQLPFYKIPVLSDPAAITTRYSQYKDRSYKLIVDSSFDYDAFIDVMAERCSAIYTDSLTASFGCCNDFYICSDALKCIKADDPYYKGCMYRKNLEAGRVFYGKNRNE